MTNNIPSAFHSTDVGFGSHNITVMYKNAHKKLLLYTQTALQLPIRVLTFLLVRVFACIVVRN